MYVRDYFYILFDSIFLQNYVEEAFIKYSKKQYKRLVLECTNSCNAKCIFCLYSKIKRSKTYLSLDDFEKILDQFLTIGGESINLTPTVGDPLLDPYFMDRLDRIISEKQIKNITFYTNAILLDKQKIERLLKFDDRLHIYISWGGFDKEIYKTIMGVDKFEQVYKNLVYLIEQKRLMNSKICIDISCRNPENSFSGEIWDEFLEYKRNELITISRISLFDNWGGAISEEVLRSIGLEPNRMSYKKGACKLLYQSPIVHADGRVSACHCRDTDQDLEIGNMHSNTLMEIYEGNKRKELINRQKAGDFPDTCQECNTYVSIYNRAWRKNNIG